MSNHDHKQSILQWFDAFNQGDIQRLDRLADELFAPNFVAHEPKILAFEPGLVGVKKFIHQLLREYTAVHITVDNVFAYQDRTGNRLTVSMTEKASGKPVSVKLLAITRFVDDRIVEAWQIYDQDQTVIVLSRHCIKDTDP